MKNIIFEDEETKSIIEDRINIKSFNNTFNKIINIISLVGEFNDKIKLSTYTNVNNEEGKIIELYCADDIGNIFVFCIVSSVKEKVGIIKHYDNKNTCIYDVKLSKKYDIDESNVKTIRNNIVYNFKLGRIITDNMTYYNILFGDNIMYTIDLDCTKLNFSELIKSLNSLEQIPDLITIIRILENSMNIGNEQLERISIAQYRDFIKVGDLIIGDEQTTIKR